MTEPSSFISRTALVGRRAELIRLSDWLGRDDCRLVTVVGPGGIGKTRLAQELCLQQESEFVWVSLDDGRIPGSSLKARLGQALELPQSSESEWDERFDTVLRTPTLFVLDSFEHIREQAPEVSRLLQKYPQLTILITSRSPLLLSDERLLTLEPLSLEQSVELLMIRAKTVRPELEATEANREILEKLCRRLDGIPLALELAAARLRHLGLKELEQGLQENIELLSGGGPDRPPRQQTLRATLEWSAQLLQPSERELLARLSVFRGGFEQKAASAVSAVPALSDLLSLSDQSLVVTSHSSTGETRYALLDTVRTWVETSLVCSAGTPEWVLSHARYYLELAKEMSRCRGGESHAFALKRLTEEKSNLSKALLSFQQAQLWDEALELVGYLGWYWEACSLLAEGRQALESVLEEKNTGPQSAEAHHWLSVLLRHQGAYHEAAEHGRKAAEYQTSKALLSETYGSLAQLFFRQGNYENSQEYFQRALDLASECGSTYGEVNALTGLGRVAWVTGRISEGIEFEHQSLRLAQEGDYHLGEAWAHNALGEIHRNLQEPRAAALHLKRAAERFGDLHEFSLGALALQNLAYVELGLKRWTEAERGFREALQLWRRAGARHGLALCLLGLAGVLGAQKKDRLGTQFLGAADGLLDSIQVRLEASDQEDYAAIQGSLRSRLGEEFKTEHWAGRQTPLVELLHSLDDPQEQRDFKGLTEREREVLKATATGASNKEVAEMLVISPQTVMVHLRSIYRKLNVSSRTAASRWAVENGLST